MGGTVSDRNPLVIDSRTDRLRASQTTVNKINANSFSFRTIGEEAQPKRLDFGAVLEETLWI